MAKTDLKFSYEDDIPAPQRNGAVESIPDLQQKLDNMPVGKSIRIPVSTVALNVSRAHVQRAVKAKKAEKTYITKTEMEGEGDARKPVALRVGAQALKA